MARYRVLLDPGAHINSRSLEVDGPQEVRTIEQGGFQRRGVGAAVDEDMLGGVMAEHVESFSDRPPAESDSVAALAVHSSLDISRRDASDADLWTFLNVTAAWPYVAWRWSRSGAVSRERVSGGLDRSALARLWWMAELVQGENKADKSQRLETLLSKQDLAVSIYERPRLIRRPGLPEQLIRVVGDMARPWNESRFRGFARSCRSFFGVRITAAYSRDELEYEVEELANRAVGSQ